MSKILKLLFIAIVGLGFLSTSAIADASKGQKLYIKELKGPCGFDGGGMAKKHTQAEWKAIFDAGKLNAEMTKQCPSAKPLKDSYVQHVYDFLYNYASDSGNVPSC
ncbi:MAG: cytochrome C [Sulfurospirillaceae bacterium]|nr:cytochrome C [Sulfurospirillaceae bacterium]MDD2825266.1 cytochrome C [Sulfurospirillaceae bacterium]